MTRVWHRRLVRLNNHFPLILGVLLVIDRVASLGARLARAML